MPGEPERPPERRERTQTLPSRSSLRKTFIACMITAGMMTYLYLGNLQLLLRSRYSAELGIGDLWLGDEGRYYLHMTAINGVITGVIVFMWVWRRMTGKRLIIMLLFFNFAALAAGYSSIQGGAYTATNGVMKEKAEELAAAARGFNTPNLNRYPRSPGELQRVYPAPTSPYSYYGQKRPMAIEIIYNATGPFEDFTRRGDQAGTLYYAVDREGKKFWITYLIYDFDDKQSVLGTDEKSGEVIVFTERE